MLKKLILFVFIVSPLAAFSQAKIAYIDAQEIIQEMPETKAAQTQLQAKQEEIKKTLAMMETEYTTKATEFSKDTVSLTPSVIEDRQKQLDQIKERYQTYGESSQNEVQTLQQTLFAPINQKLQKAIKDVGAEQGYSYILLAGATVYIAPSAPDAAKFVRTKLGIAAKK